jgi:hypothetical protein
MKPLRRRLTYANVMSSIAVFLVVAGGPAFAASQLGKESVGTKQLKKEAVSLAKINAAAKTSLKGATGPKGSTGPQGPKGDKGDKGEKGDTGPSTGPAGGALTGNYPNPLIAAGAVNGSSVADRSLDANDVTQASGQFSRDFASFPGNSCEYELVNTGLPDLTGYLLFASPGNAGGWPEALIVNPYLSNLAGYLRVRVCNVTATASDPPLTTFNWAVMKVG